MTQSRVDQTAFCLAALLALSGAAKGATVETIYTFNPLFISIYQPEGQLAVDGLGALYGTAHTGHHGFGGGGEFKLSPPSHGTTVWSVTVLNSRSSYQNGDSPEGGLIFAGDQDVALFGAATQAGYNNCGAIFGLRLTPTGWHTNPLWDFRGQSADGCAPASVPAEDASGALYGTTTTGGASNGGIAYKLTPPPLGQTTWAEVVLYSFPAPAVTGAFADSPLLLGKDGSLYGNGTAGSSAAPYGTVFRLTPPQPGQSAWSFATLWSFHGSDGSLPTGPLVQDAQGNLYGTCGAGGGANAGTVFELSPPAAGQEQWTQATLWSFSGKDGKPLSGVVFDGARHLLGSTTLGNGGLFQLNQAEDGSWTEQVLWTFASLTNPLSPLTQGLDGAWYGSTAGGLGNHGTIYRLTP